MDWFTLSIFSGLLFALSRSISRYALRSKGNPLAFTAVHDFIAGLVLLPFIFWNFRLPEHGITWVYFVIVVILVFLVDYLALLALKNIEVSIYQIVIQSRHVLVLFAGLLFFSESITPEKIIAIILIIFGVLIVMYEKAKIKWTKGVTYAISSTFFAVLAFSLMKYIMRDFSETAFASFELMAAGLLAFSFTKFKAKDILEEIKINKWWIFIAGGLFGLFELVLFLALKIGEISKVIPVSQSSLIFAVLIGILFMGERDKLWQKFIGVLVIVVGFLFMYLF